MSKEVFRFQRRPDGGYDTIWKDSQGKLYIGENQYNAAPASTLYSDGHATTRDYYRDGQPVWKR